VVKSEASRAFVQAWDYSFFWSTLVSNEVLGKYQSDMGHAEYAAGGSAHEREEAQGK
jgi:hypothetical protein